MVTAQDILIREITQIDANEPFHKVISLFKDTDAIVITENKLYKGMLLKRCLMEPKLSLQTKVHNAITHTPKLSLTEPLEEIARVMVENHVYHLPVIQNDHVIGIVTADGVLKKLTEQTIGSQPIKTIMCTQPLSINPEETLGKVIKMFQQQDIPYLAVIDHNNVVGVITMDDVLEHVMHPDIKIKGYTGHGDFAPEKTSKLALPVKSIMKEQPVMLSPETSIRDVHTHMHRFDVNGVLIGSEHRLHGIVTHKELLAPYAAGFDKEETIAIQFHHRNNKVKDFDKEQTVQFLREEFLKNYEKYLEVGYLHVSLEQHKEIKQGLFRVVCEMKLSGKPGVFYATQEGYGPMQAMRNAFLAIEHQINKVKKT
ncbi:MAG: CBS domain-containing protein [Thermoplasmata archaeon]|nr:CBS domain-containing protein [Thermoplasmata archaeon]MBE3141005.1 CBS domain-containing protein [Thermoplasmata archaeon]